MAADQNLLPFYQSLLCRKLHQHRHFTPLQAELSSCCCSTSPVDRESGKLHTISCRSAGNYACPGFCTFTDFSYILDSISRVQLFDKDTTVWQATSNLRSAEKAVVPDWHCTINLVGNLSPSTNRSWNPGQFEKKNTGRSQKKARRGTSNDTLKNCPLKKAQLKTKPKDNFYFAVFSIHILSLGRAL